MRGLKDGAKRNYDSLCERPRIYFGPEREMNYRNERFFRYVIQPEEAFVEVDVVLCCECHSVSHHLSCERMDGEIRCTSCHTKKVRIDCGRLICVTEYCKEHGHKQTDLNQLYKEENPNAFSVCCRCGWISGQTNTTICVNRLVCGHCDHMWNRCAFIKNNESCPKCLKKNIFLDSSHIDLVANVCEKQGHAWGDPNFQASLDPQDFRQNSVYGNNGNIVTGTKFELESRYDDAFQFIELYVCRLCGTRQHLLGVYRIRTESFGWDSDLLHT